MAKIIFSVENTCDIPLKELDALGVRHINIHFHNVKTGEEDPDLTLKEFYDEIRKGESFKTSLVNEQEFYDYFKEICQEGDVLHLGFTGGLSGNAKSAKDAAERINAEGGNRICVVDTLTGSGAQAILLRELLKRPELSIDEMVKFADEFKYHLCLNFTPEDMKTLAKSGRLNKVLALVGTLLNIKPIVYCNNEGKFSMRQKVISRKKAVLRMIELFKENYNFESEYVYILHGDKVEDAEYIKSQIESDERFTSCKIIIEYLGVIVGAHGGPGNLCMCFTANKR